MNLVILKDGTCSPSLAISSWSLLSIRCRVSLGQLSVAHLGRSCTSRDLEFEKPSFFDSFCREMADGWSCMIRYLLVLVFKYFPAVCRFSTPLWQYVLVENVSAFFHSTLLEKKTVCRFARRQHVIWKNLLVLKYRRNPLLEWLRSFSDEIFSTFSIVGGCARKANVRLYCQQMSGKPIVKNHFSADVREANVRLISAKIRNLN